MTKKEKKKKEKDPFLKLLLCIIDSSILGFLVVDTDVY